MDYEKKYKIGDYVTAKEKPTNVRVEGEFCGYALADKSDPTSVVGHVLVKNDPRIHGKDNLYSVGIESIKLTESEDERIRSLIYCLIRDRSDNRKLLEHNGVSVDDALAYLEKHKTSEEAIRYVKENHSPDEVSDFQAAMNIAVAKAYDKGVQDTLEKQKEQKLTNTNLAFEIGDVITDGTSTFEIVDIKDEYYIADDGDKVCFYVAHRYYTPIQHRETQMPAEWSEEDETFVKDAIEAAENYYSKGCGQEELVAWLKSLRPQPKQDWSEEDKEILSEKSEQFCWNLGEMSYKGAKWSEEDRHAIENCEYAIKETFKDEQNPHRIGTLDWLKSLRPSWKPSEHQSSEWSEEDEDFINMLILHFNYLIDEGGDSVETYKSYKEKLKSLRSRPKKSDNWKPGEEQMKALNAVNCYGGISYVGQQNVLISLYNDLKKLM